MVWRAPFALPAVALAVAVSVVPHAQAVSEGEVRRLQEKCESAREESLQPIRERRTQACIDQQLRSPDSCEVYYSTYGNVSPGPSGAPQPGLF